jgi:hypothetical protein
MNLRSTGNSGNSNRKWPKLAGLATAAVLLSAISSVLGLGIAPIAALAQTAVIVNSDTNAQQNIATQVQNADELVDDQGEGGSNPSNNGATVTGGEFQTAEVDQENNLVDNDVNTIDLDATVTDSNVQTDVAAESNNPVDNDVNININATGG